MDKFRYLITQDAFNKATTIKERVRIFEEVLREKPSPYGYTLSKELKALLRPRDILNRHVNTLRANKNVLKSRARNAKLTQEEITMVFGSTVIEFNNMHPTDIVKLCNKVPNINCSVHPSTTSASNRLHDIAYSARGVIELVMLRDTVNDYQTNALYKQLTSTVTAYDTVVAPLLQLIADLEPLRNPLGISTTM